MTHLDERTLERLLNREMSTRDIEAVLLHADDCRDCARKLEEWRDHFEEMASIIPEKVRNSQAAMAFPQAFVLVSPDDAPAKRRFDATSLLWVAAVGLALIVGYSASRLNHRAADGLAINPTAETDPPPEGTRPGTLVDTMDQSENTPPVVIDSAAAADAPDTNPAPAKPAPTQPKPAPSDAESRLAATPGKPPQPPTSRFERIALGEASRRLGAVRFVSNLSPDHLEVGPGSEVPGAQKNLDVVRVVYLSRDGSRILLDQQRMPVDESGFRTINDAALENGDTLYGSTSQGVSVATWVDSEGFRLSLAARASTDSLRKLVQAVR
jgi:hypothetical protein